LENNQWKAIILKTVPSETLFMDITAEINNAAYCRAIGTLFTAYITAIDRHGTWGTTSQPYQFRTIYNFE
jgi:hypothetical protein